MRGFSGWESPAASGGYQRPLSKSASTACCSMRFSLRMMTSGALRSTSEGRQLKASATQHRPGAAAVAAERINGLLQHAFFVADDDFRRVEIDE